MKYSHLTFTEHYGFISLLMLEFKDKRFFDRNFIPTHRLNRKCVWVWGLNFDTKI